MPVANGERQPTRGFPTDYRRDFSTISNRFALVNHGFDIDEVALQNWSAEDTDILVIADPREPYSQEAMERLQDYLDEGGDMVLLVEQQSTRSVDLLLGNLGLSRGAALSQAHDEGYPETLVLGSMAGSPLTSYWGEASLLPVGLEGAVELLELDDAQDFERTPIITAAEAHRVGAGASRKPNDQSPIVGYSLERQIDGESQRILVFGDADLYSTARAERRDPVTANGLMGAFHYLTEGQYPVQRTRRDTIDTTLRIERTGIEAMRWALVGGVPLMILSIGGFLLLVRSRR